MVVKQPQFTRVEEPTLLCNQTRREWISALDTIESLNPRAEQVNPLPLWLSAHAAKP
jgi:hypothetical protein